MIGRWSGRIGAACALCLALVACQGAEEGGPPGGAATPPATAAAAPADAKPTGPASPADARPGPGQPTPVPRVGRRSEIGGLAIFVHSVNRREDAGTVRASAGQTLLIAEVTLQNVSHELLEYSASQFSVQTSNGDKVVAVPGPDTPLDSGRLRQGERIRGYLAFEVPQDATDLPLTYDASDTISGASPVMAILP